MAKENDTKLVVLGQGSLGEVKVADEVVSIIAGYAATEVDGVSAMAGNITSALMSKVGMKTLSNGVKVYVEGEQIRADLAIIVDYGYSIPGTSKKVQDKVKAAIENMTGLTVTDVNIRIAGVALESNTED